MAATVLAQRQRELMAPTATDIGLRTVVTPTIGQPLTGSPKRAAAAIGALAGLGSLAAVYGFESLMTYRRRRAAGGRLGVDTSGLSATAPGVGATAAGELVGSRSAREER